MQRIGGFMENGWNCYECDICLKVGIKNLLIFYKFFFKELVEFLIYGVCELKFLGKLGIVVFLILQIDCYLF